MSVSTGKARESHGAESQVKKAGTGVALQSQPRLGTHQSNEVVADSRGKMRQIPEKTKGQSVVLGFIGLPLPYLN